MFSSHLHTYLFCRLYSKVILACFSFIENSLHPLYLLILLNNNNFSGVHLLLDPPENIKCHHECQSYGLTEIFLNIKTQYKFHVSIPGLKSCVYYKYSIFTSQMIDDETNLNTA